MNVILCALASSILAISLSPSALAEGEGTAAEPTTYSFVGNADLHHVRFPDTDQGNYGLERNAVGVNWVDGTGNFVALDDVNASWVRLLVNADKGGSYEIPIEYKAGAYPIRVFVNSASSFKEFNLPDGGWGVVTNTISLDLEEGKNVLVIEMAQWGGLRSFSLPSGLTLIRSHGESGTYTQSEIVYQAVYLSGFANEDELFDPESPIEYGTLGYDTSRDYQGAAIAFITPEEGHPSLDVKIKIASKANGASYLGYVVGSDNVSSPYLIDLSSFEVGEEATIHLPSYALSKMGYSSGTENYVRITNETSGAAFQVLEIRESDAVDEDPTIGMKIIEADELKGMVAIRGRSIDMDGAIPLDWSASGLDFVFEGKGDIALNLDITSNNQNTAFVVEVDGKTHRVAAAARTVIASFEEEGRHEISIYKTSEAAGNLLAVTSMEVDEDATVSKPDAKALKFEFIGDSITCANQTASGVEDAYEGFARRLASAYDADFDLISVSGRGLMEGYNSESGWAPSKDAQMKDIYDYESYFRDPSVRHVTEAGDEPDVVFVGLGSNDLGKNIMTTLGTTIDDFTKEVVSFAQKVRFLYPNAKILFSYGSFVNRYYVDEYRAAVEGLNDPAIAFLEFPQMMLGDSGHPNELNHDTMAAMMSKETSRLLGIEDPYEPQYVYEVYEAEDAAIKGGSITTVTPEDGQYWSGLAYVGEMGFDSADSSYPSSVEEIADDMGNISYLDFQVDAKTSGKYELRIGLATSTTSVFGVKVDGGAWQSQTFTGTDWCGGHAVYYPMTVNLAAGTHHIYISSSLNAGGWANYDYIALIEGEPIEDHLITAEEGNGYSVSGYPERVLDGDGFSFKVDLESNYSQSDIKVYANDVLLSRQEDGTYKVDGVTEDIEIRVEGVAINVWEARFYSIEGDEEPFAITRNEVGSEIALPSETPTRDGYEFAGWDITFDSQPNGNIDVYAKWTKIENPTGGGSSSSSSSSLPSSSDGASSSSSASMDGASSIDSSYDSGTGSGSDGNGGLTSGEIIAIVSGSVGGVIVIGVAAVLLFRFLKKRK